MATTFVEQTGDGDATVNFTFPSYQSSDVKVRVDDDLKDAGVHYNIINYTTTGGGDVVFTSGNIPNSPALIRIYRDTNVDTAKATYQAGSSVKAADLNNNNTQLLYRAQEEQIPNLIHSYDIDDGAITSAKFGADSVTGDKIADDQINSEHYVDGSIDTAHIADAQITTAKLAADAVTNAKIANDSIDSEHYVDGSIDTAHIADAQITTAKLVDANVTTAKIADSNVTTAKIADSNITTAKLAADAVTNAKIADDSIDSEHYVDGSIDTAHIGNLQVTTAKIAADAVDGTKIADDSINSEHYVDGSIDTAHIADSQITSAKIASNAVTTDKIADGELTTLAGMQSTTASNLASSTALTATTAELNQLDGITLETSVTTNSDTRIPTSKAVNDLVLSVTNALGGFVAIANETSFPTTNPDPSNNAGTVVSISQLSTGLAVNSSGVATISNGAGTGNTVTITGFPANLQSQTLPASSGLQVQTTSTLHTYTFHKQLASAADIQAISATVNSFSNRYRVSASAPTSSLDGGDLWYDTTNSKLMVYSSQNSAWEESSAIGNFFISTISSSSNTGGGSATANGTAYRFTISDAPVSAQQLIVSVDGVIQKPNSGSSQPSEGFVLVGNDIIFGAAPANGASLFVTVIGSTVGIGTPSNNTVTTAILQNGSVTTAKIVDANVTTAKIADANVTTAKIADSNVTTAKIADDAVTAAKLANTSVTAGSYGSSTSIPSITVDAQGRITAASTNTVNTTTNLATTTATGSVTVTSSTGNNATISEATSSAAGVMSTAHHDKLDGIEASATADQTNSEIAAALSDQRPSMKGATFTDDGTSSPVVEIKADDANPWGLIIGNTAYSTNQRGIKMLQEDGGHTKVRISGQGEYRLLNFEQDDGSTSRALMTLSEDGSVYLRHQGTIKFNTTNTGAKFSGQSGSHTDVTIQGYEGYDANLNLYADEGDDNADKWRILASTDGSFYLQNYTSGSWEFNLKATGNGAVELYYDNDKKFLTQSDGVLVADGGTLYFANDSENAFSSIRNVGGSGVSNLIFAAGGVDRWQILNGGHLVPQANNAYDIGMSSYRIRNIYTNDLHLSNEGHSNDVDGTWGDWTIQEGESDLFLKNNRSGKKYKFNLTEVS